MSVWERVWFHTHTHTHTHTLSLSLSLSLSLLSFDFALLAQACDHAALSHACRLWTQSRAHDHRRRAASCTGSGSAARAFRCGCGCVPLSVHARCSVECLVVSHLLPLLLHALASSALLTRTPPPVPVAAWSQAPTPRGSLALSRQEQSCMHAPYPLWRACGSWTSLVEPTLALSVCMCTARCICVSSRERERERDRECIHTCTHVRTHAHKCASIHTTTSCACSLQALGADGRVFAWGCNDQQQVCAAFSVSLLLFLDACFSLLLSMLVRIHDGCCMNLLSVSPFHFCLVLTFHLLSPLSIFFGCCGGIGMAVWRRLGPAVLIAATDTNAGQPWRSTATATPHCYDRRSVSTRS